MITGLLFDENLRDVESRFGSVDKVFREDDKVYLIWAPSREMPYKLLVVDSYGTIEEKEE